MSTARFSTWTRLKADWQLIWRWRRYLARFRWILVAGAVLLLVSTSLQLATPLLTGVIIDRVLLEKRETLLHAAAILLVLVTLAYMASNLIRSFLVVRVKIRVALAMHQDLMLQLHRLSFSYTSKKQSGYLASRVIDDPSTVYEFMINNVLTIVQNVVTFCVALAVMLWVNWKVALLSMVILPFYLLVGARFVDRLRSLSLRATEALAQRSRVLFETLAGLYTINACGAERQMLRRFFSQQKDVVRTQVEQFVLGSKVSFIRSGLAALGPILVLWYGGLLVIRGDLSIGQLVALSAIFGYLFNSAQYLGSTQVSLQKVLVALERIFEILDLRPALDFTAVNGRRPPTALSRGVELRKVTFSYDQGKEVLHDVDLLIPARKVVSLAGRSGAGKSTIAHLLMRFYDPQQGSIWIDDLDLRTIPLTALHQWIALVPQDVFLFSVSVEDNIRLGRRNATRFEVVQAARLAEAHEFIEELPHGYATVLGERGLSLSGGQRQRIGIARALLRQPRLLILDEAVSAVDGASEMAICETVRSLNAHQGITAIVIAHRLSTILRSDLIHLIEGGRVVCSGDHPTLLATCPEYQRFIRFQGRANDGLRVRKAAADARTA